MSYKDKQFKPPCAVSRCPHDGKFISLVAGKVAWTCPDHSEKTSDNQ